jgi:DNA-binding response OmpR family regulator
VLTPVSILVVEDDPLVQIFVEEALDEGGFQPKLASSGEEAMDHMAGHKGIFCALITDISLGGKVDGWDVARRAREIDPSFPVVYMTGAASEHWKSRGVPNSVLLAKPFAPAQLVTVLSNLLNVRHAKP